MSGYYGTETQQRLQAQAETSADYINATAGACQTGRTMGCDDLDRLGWDRIDEFLDRDGICGFRLIPADRSEELRSLLAERNFRFDYLGRVPWRPGERAGCLRGDHIQGPAR